MTPFGDGVFREEEEGWLCRSAGQEDTEPFSASGTRSPCCCRQGWVVDGDPLALAGTWEGSSARMERQPWGALTNVGVLQETADPGFSLQLLVI